MYQLAKNLMGEVNSVIRLSDNAVIPFAPENTDYQQFKKDLIDGTSLKDADGNEMNAEQIASFLGTLP
jgi:hypothetical protein